MWQIPGDPASPEIPGIPGLDFHPCFLWISPLTHLISPLPHLDFLFATCKHGKNLVREGYQKKIRKKSGLLTCFTLGLECLGHF